jgi:transcription elongation factor GreB
MSKAFTKEDEAGEDLDPEAEPKFHGKRYITPEGYRRLQDELVQLWRVERPKVTAEVSAAAAQGDRSENAEYTYGKRRLREIDRRVRYLGKLLDRLTVVEPSKAQNGRVFFGATVTVEDEDGERATYKIVGPDEFDVKAGKISIDSPLAKALLGKHLDDEVTVQRPKGPVDVTVVEIRYDGV